MVAAGVVALSLSGCGAGAVDDGKNASGSATCDPGATGAGQVRDQVVAACPVTSTDPVLTVPAVPATPLPTVAVPPVTRTFSDRPPRAGFHEFPANCTVSHRLSDDPIVLPGLAGASHNHSFIGNPATNAHTVPKDLLGGRTSCQDPKDASAYWFPTLLQNGQVVAPQTVTVYYKSDVKDYRTVLPFPPGFRLLAGNPRATSLGEFGGYWTCGGNEFADIPASCPEGSSLIVRLTAPSCWDGVHLDSADHTSHTAYPVDGVCPGSHPVPLPMLQLKVPYKLPGGNTTKLAYASGPGYTFHFDFMNGWDQARLTQIIEYCVNGGRQCNGDGVD